MSTTPRMVYADSTGQIFDHPKLRMGVWDGASIREPLPEELIPLPEGSDLFLLPGRLPLGFSGKRSHLIEFDGGEEEELSAVSAFLAPAYLRLHHPAYRTLAHGPMLPLFAYSPVGWADGVFWTTGLRIDPEKRQDPPLFDMKRIRRGVDRDLGKYPRNRLLRHLRRCALEYGCRAAQNFFLARWECPLPTASSCNAQCIGCISHQDGDIPVTQERIDFAPSAKEIAQVTCLHFGRVERPIASFGQGCEGEPLTRGDLLVDAVSLVRERCAEGTLNLNTNASRPDVVERLFSAGLSSIRVSLASPRKEAYDAYHRPSGYSFADVLESMRVAKGHNGFISLNLLVFPGFTDRAEEVEALKGMVREFDVDMIQWRNLNLDPEYYGQTVGQAGSVSGLRQMVLGMKDEFPDLKHGYFNPFLG